mgnify:FL=1
MFKSDHIMELLHSYNKKVIFNYIRVNELISRSELSQRIGVSATAITRLVNSMIETGMVEEVGVCDVDSVGRRPIMLSVCKDCMYALGVNIDIDEVVIGCINVQGEVIRTLRTSDFDGTDPENVVQTVLKLYRRLLDELDAPVREKIIGMGVGAPGVIDWPEGHTRVTPQLHWHPFPLRERLRSLLDIEVLVDNNVKAIATAESMFGGRKGNDSFFVLEIGSGLGAAYVLDGRVLRGSNGVMGEIGHTLAVENGVRCDCGRNGCLQAYTCISGLETRLGMPIEQIMRLRRSNERVQTILDEAVRYLSKAVANVINYYNPGAIIAYGRLFDLWPELFDLLRIRSREMLWLPKDADFHFYRSSLDNESSRVLAAASVFFSDTLLPEVMIRKSALKSEKQTKVYP